MARPFSARPSGPIAMMLPTLGLHVHLKSPDIQPMRRQTGLESFGISDEKIVCLHSLCHHIGVHRMIDHRQMDPHASHVVRMHFKSN